MLGHIIPVDPLKKARTAEQIVHDDFVTIFTDSLEGVIITACHHTKIVLALKDESLKGRGLKTKLRLVVNDPETKEGLSVWLERAYLGRFPVEAFLVCEHPYHQEAYPHILDCSGDPYRLVTVYPDLCLAVIVRNGVYGVLRNDEAQMIYYAIQGRDPRDFDILNEKDTCHSGLAVKEKEKR